MNRGAMKFKVLIVSVFFICSLLIGICLAQNKVVVIPLMSDCNPIQTVTSADGRVWMDRNLGAIQVAQSKDDYHAYGYLYQWGRLADGHEDRGSLTTTTRSAGDVPGHDDFIVVASSPFDWLTQLNNDLWQGVSGINNPCPSGFRLPTGAEWEAEIISWSSDDDAGAFDSPLKLVLAGNKRLFDSNIDMAGDGGYYWSSTVSDSRARGLTIGSGSALMNDTYRAYGISVRCIKN